MSWFNRRSRGAEATPTKLDREATRDDLAALEAFVATRRGVEFYLEPETTATDTTVMAIAHDGEWIRRRTGMPARPGPSPASTLCRCTRRRAPATRSGCGPGAGPTRNATPADLCLSAVFVVGPVVALPADHRAHGRTVTRCGRSPDR